MTDTISCPNCSASLPSAATFCTSCGTRLGDTATAAPAGPTDPPADATLVDHPGLHDSTQVFTPPPPPAAPPAPPASNPPWQPADATPPPAPPAGAPWSPPGTPPGQSWQQPPAAPPAQGWGPPAAAPAGQWGATATTPGSTGTTDKAGSPIGGLLAVLGGILTLIGLFTAWVGNNQTDETTSGWDLVSGDKGLESQDPYLILALGLGALVIGGLLFTGAARQIARIAAIVVGLVIVGVAARDWLSIADLAKDLPSDVEITAKFGFYLTIAGGIVTALASLLPAARKRATTSI
ncbi:MAG TPA: zinc ribbon domain-containing protein [Aquihabitans sp.]|nr:zinc ribbon domain-containing protein [Aquihabitans sp.]